MSEFIPRRMGEPADAARNRNRSKETHQVVESRVQIALELAGIGYWDWDLRNGYMRWEPHLNRIMGLSPDAMVGNYIRFLEQIHPEDRPKVEETFRNGIATGADSAVQFRVGTGRRIRWVDARGRCFKDPENKPWRMVGIVRDITTEKEMEHVLPPEIRASV